MICRSFLEFYIESAETTIDDIDNFQLEAMIVKEINKELEKKFKNATILDEKDEEEDEMNDDENDKKEKKKKPVKDDQKIDIEKEKQAKEKLKIIEGKFDACVKKFDELKEGNANFSRKYPRLTRILRYAVTIAVVLISIKVGPMLIFKKLGAGLLGKILAFILSGLHIIATGAIAVIVNKEMNKRQVKNVVGFYNVNAEYLDKKIEECDDAEGKQKLKNIKYNMEKNAKSIQGKYYATYKMKLDDDEN